MIILIFGYSYTFGFMISVIFEIILCHMFNWPTINYCFLYLDSTCLQNDNIRAERTNHVIYVIRSLVEQISS